MVHLVREPNRVTANLAKSKRFFYMGHPQQLFVYFRLFKQTLDHGSTLLFHPSSTLCSFGFQIRKLYIVLSMKASRHRISVLGKIQESQLLYGSDVIAIATKTNERG